MYLGATILVWTNNTEPVYRNGVVCTTRRPKYCNKMLHIFHQFVVGSSIFVTVM